MTALIKYDTARRALAECIAVDEVKAWADKAEAMRAYGRMAKDKTLEVDAAEIRIRAERRLGELISAQKLGVGLNPGKLKQGPVVVGDDHGKNQPKLSDVGVSKDLSSRAQKLAAVPEAEFEAEVGEWRDRVKAEGARVTTRLEKAGAKAIQAAAAPAEDDAFDGFDPVAELEATQKLLEAADKRIEALTVDDVKAELNKQIGIRQGIEARLSLEMSKVGQLQKDLDSYGKWYAELRKLTGLEKRSDITKLVREAANNKSEAV